MNSQLTFEAEPFRVEAESTELEEASAGGASGGARQPSFALLNAIPNVPNFPRNTPIYYWLNAKEIVGEVAQDLSSRGKSAHIWVELGHWSIVAAEIFAEASVLVAGLAIFAPLLAVVAVGYGLGAPYYEASVEIAARWAASGFSRGVVMGANRQRASLLRDYFGNDYIPVNYFIPRGQAIASGNYKMGLFVGFIQGRLLSPNQHAIFWRDLGYRMGDQSYRGSPQQWTRRDWIDWYVTAAAVFRRDHLV